MKNVYISQAIIFESCSLECMINFFWIIIIIIVIIIKIYKFQEIDFIKHRYTEVKQHMTRSVDGCNHVTLIKDDFNIQLWSNLLFTKKKN